MFTLGQKLAHHNMNTQHPFFTTDNNGFNMRTISAYFHAYDGCPEDAIYDAFDPEWHYFRFLDNNTIIFELIETDSYPHWTELIKAKYENGVWSHAQATCMLNDDNVIPESFKSDPERYITRTDPDWNTL